MSYAFMSVMLFLAACGLVGCIMGISHFFSRRDTDGKYVVLYIDEKNAEYAVRRCAFFNPDSEIIVVNKAPSAETTEILDRLQREYERIHIL